MREYSLDQINSNAHNFLANAQEDLEKAIAAFALASDEHAEAETRLRIAREEATLMLRDQGNPVGLIDTLVRGKATAYLKEESMKAEGRVKHAQHLIRSIENRINSVKFIGRRTDEAAQ